MSAINHYILREKIRWTLQTGCSDAVCMSWDEFSEAVVAAEERRPGATELVENSEPVRADGSPDYGYYDSYKQDPAFHDYQKLQETTCVANEDEGNR